MGSQLPPVIEVTAEIGFATGNGAELTEQAGPHLFGKLKRRYPLYERATDVQLQVEMHDDIDAIEARCDRVSHRFLYRADPPTVVVQLSSEALQLQFYGPYLGWEKILDIIEREWTTTAQALELRLGTHVLLRYVCHLPFVPTRQSVGYWLKSNAYTPEALRPSNQDYQCHVELFDPSTEVTTGVGVAPSEVHIPQALEVRPFALDVGLNQDLSHRVVRKSACAYLQQLHGHIKAILDDTLSEQTQQHLKQAQVRLADGI